MDNQTIIGIAGVVVFLLGLFIGLPIGITMALVGVFGTFILLGEVAFRNAPLVIFARVASWELTVIPMFIAMGYFAFHFEFGKNAFDMAFKWTHKVPGGAAVAALLAGGLFGACCGSSVAATITMTKMALPEMEKHGYQKGLAAGSIASAGTLAALIPPSVLAVIYGIFTQTSITRLLIAILVPGLVLMVIYIISVMIRCKLNPKLAGPVAIKTSWAERFSSLKGGLPIILIFIFIFAGLFLGVFTPTEAGALGAFITIIVGLIMRRVKGANFIEALRESLRSNCALMFIMAGALVFIQFLSLTRLPITFGIFMTSLSIPPLAIFCGFVVVYLILGFFLEGFGILMLTIPFIFTTMVNAGFDPIWLGVVVIELVELGQLSPPVAVQAYAIKTVAPELSYKDIFGGILPFWLISLFIFIPLLVAFPQIATYLPSLMVK